MVTTEDRVSRLEGAYEQVDRRLDDLNTRLSDLSNQVDRRFEVMDRRFDAMDRRFNSLMVIVAGSWITMMAAIISGIVIAN